MVENTDCYCSDIEGGGTLICHHHYAELFKDADLRKFLDNVSNKDDVEIEYMCGIPIVRGKKDDI